MRIALALLALLAAACTKPAEPPFVGNPIDPVFVGTYDLNWHIPDPGCWVPEPLHVGFPTLVIIGDRGEIVWRSTGHPGAEFVHYGQMEGPELVVPPGEDGGVERHAYHYESVAGVLWAAPSWTFDDLGTRLCVVDLVRRLQEN
jgi:hypothetical protein